MPQAALRELLALGNQQGEASFSGADPVLRTPYRVATAGAAALAATGLAASELWALRTGRRQPVAVDLRAAAASLRSGYYLRIDGKPPPEAWDPSPPVVVRAGLRNSVPRSDGANMSSGARLEPRLPKSSDNTVARSDALAFWAK